MSDALRIGSVAAVGALLLGLVLLAALNAAGVLVVYGVRIPTLPAPLLLVGVGVGAAALTVVGAGLATVGLVRVAPARLLHADGRREGGDRDD